MKNKSGAPYADAKRQLGGYVACAVPLEIDLIGATADCGSNISKCLSWAPGELVNGKQQHKAQ